MGKQKFTPQEIAAALRESFVGPPEEDINPKQVIKALQIGAGFKHKAAEILKCQYATVVRYIYEYPEVQLAVALLEDQWADMVQYKLYEANQRGEPWSIQFILQTKFKHHGYVRRTEHAVAHLDGGIAGVLVEPDLDKLTDDDLRAMIDVADKLNPPQLGPGEEVIDVEPEPDEGGQGPDGLISVAGIRYGWKEVKGKAGEP